MSAPLAVAFAAVAGLAGAVQVAVNAKLGERIGLLPAFTFSLLVSATIAIAMLLAIRQSVGGIVAGLHEPPWLWLGGVMGVVIVFAITAAGARIGTTATVGMLVAGQFVMGLVIDRLGLFGLDRIPVTWPRALGVVLLAAGAALSLRS